MNSGNIICSGLTWRAAGLLLTLVAVPASAQFGPILSGAGPINRSMAGASTATPLSSSGALLWNPATLSGLSSSELEFGVELLVPQANIASSISADAFGAGAPSVNLSGSTDNQDAVFALPTVGLAYRPEDSPFTYGLGIFAVAGFGLDYPGSNTNPVLTAPAPNGLGFGPLYSQYQVLQVAPALVYDVNDQLAVSVSPILDIGSLQLDPALFAAPDDANGDTFATYPRGTHARTAWGGGFSVGAFYQTCNWNYGASYKSTQWFQSYEYNTTDELGVARTAQFGLDIPAITSIGTSYKGFEHLLLAADLRYLDFNSTQGFGDAGFSSTGALQGVGYSNIFAVALGAQVQMTDALTLRMGYSWNENPISDSQTAVNSASPVIIEHMLAGGASYQVTNAFALSMAYTHAFENSIAGPIVLPTGPVPGTSIVSTASADMFLFGATVKFGCPRR